MFDFTHVVTVGAKVIALMAVVILTCYLVTLAVVLLIVFRRWRATVAAIACGSAVFYLSPNFTTVLPFWRAAVLPLLGACLGIAVATFTTSDRKIFDLGVPPEPKLRAIILAIAAGLISSMIGALSGAGKPVIDAIFGLELSEFVPMERVYIRATGAVLGFFSGAIASLFIRALYLGPRNVEHILQEQESQSADELSESKSPVSSDSRDS